MTLTNEVLTKLTTPKPIRKGASEEHIYAENQKARKTAELVASLARASTQKKEGV